ncbi:MAG: 30S ribosomal protein S3 [Clostridia bacterium]|nr:30S ribosomal protein S3 [Clostridia bacterium]
MGQKVNPHGMRVGVNAGWDSKWYADKKLFGYYLKQDDEIRKHIKTKYYVAGISKVEIQRTSEEVKVDIYTGKPGVLIGKAGAGSEAITSEIAKIAKGLKVSVNIIEVKKVDLDAQLIAEGIASQLEKRVAFRRAMRQALQRAMKAGAKGVKTKVGGRLDGAEIARSEEYHEGSIPLHTLRADIDYGFAQAKTTFGIIGVKVWIYKGEVLRNKKRRPSKEVTENVNA